MRAWDFFIIGGIALLIYAMQPAGHVPPVHVHHYPEDEESEED